MDEVLWHSATWRFSKSIFVKIPRLPTIRVMGSQFISTNFLEPVGVPFAAVVIVPMFSAPFFSVRPGSVASGQLWTRVPPLWFLVHGFVCECAQRPDGLAVDADGRGGNFSSWGFIHEGHELIREAWHGAADADAADVRAPTD